MLSELVGVHLISRNNHIRWQCYLNHNKVDLFHELIRGL